MGMSIDNAISDLTELKICGVVPFTKGTMSGGNYKVITGDCLDIAIDTMRKYQKIQEIINTWHHDIEAKDFECMAEIADVVEDGNE